VVDAIERSIPIPKVEIAMHRAARRQVFGKSPPLATGGKNIHHAVEAHPVYYEILRRNIDRMGQNQRVKAVQALIGRGECSGALIASNGTAKLETTHSGTCVTHRLDYVLEDYRDVALIKVDTDGFDFDVLMSGINTIKRTQPLLFWEGGTTDTGKFKQLYEDLSAIGYSSFWVFDNFGNLIVEECSIKYLADFDRYVGSQYKFECTRTIHYTDVLASTEKTVEMAISAVAKYRRELIERC
jgi:FkbM family methyltransferase